VLFGVERVEVVVVVDLFAAGQQEARVDVVVAVGADVHLRAQINGRREDAPLVAEEAGVVCGVRVDAADRVRVVEGAVERRALVRQHVAARALGQPAHLEAFARLGHVFPWRVGREHRRVFAATGCAACAARSARAADRRNDARDATAAADTTGAADTAFAARACATLPARACATLPACACACVHLRDVLLVLATRAESADHQHDSERALRLTEFHRAISCTNDTSTHPGAL
jgi:hypothetical protein